MPILPSLDESSGSIHDIDSAPEAPLHSPLGLGEPLSPISHASFPHRRHLSSPSYFFSSQKNFLPSLLAPRLDAAEDDEQAFLPRRRSDTAPARLNNIEGSENNGRCRTDPSIIEEVPTPRAAPHHIWPRSNSGFSESEGDEGADDFLADQSDGNWEVNEHEEHEQTTYDCRFIARCCISGMEARISSCVVRHAPCFWFCCKRLTPGATDRSILYRLNLLSAFFALVMIGVSAFLFVVMTLEIDVDQTGEVERNPDSGKLGVIIWNLNGHVLSLGLISVIIFFVSICTLKIITEVNLRGAVRYLWVLVWILPFQFFFVISLVDVPHVSLVWIKHWWRAPSMGWFREFYCEEGTANSLCAVPINGSLTCPNETQWCELYFNSTECTAIRDAAQDEMEQNITLFYWLCALWGFMMIILNYLTISMLEGIITKPIVQASREANAPAWMFVPTVGCSFIGVLFLFNSAEVFKEKNAHTWVGTLYIISGGFFFISATLGWFTSTYSILNSRDKWNKHFAVLCHIVINLITAGLMIAIFGGSVYSSVLLTQQELTDTERGRVACRIDPDLSCTWCNNRIGVPECPEFTEEDVSKVIQIQYKASASLAIIFILYATTSVRFGVLMKRNIELYQIDFV